MKLKVLFMRKMLVRSRKKIRKKPPYIGEQFFVSRDNKKAVEVFFYRPKKPAFKQLPAVINIHGGGWVGGDATLLDTQSQEMADRLSAFVINVNYTKLDVKPFPYAQEETKDAVLYFAEHANEYNLDVTRFSLIGYSAGGHICLGTSFLLRDCGFKLNSQVPCYPFLDFSTFNLAASADKLSDDLAEQKKMKEANDLMHEIFFCGGTIDKTQPILSPGHATLEELQGLAPIELVICGKDLFYEPSVGFYEKLKEAGIPSSFKSYDESIHGFLEVNYPETPENGAKSPKQEGIMHECEAYIKERLYYRWGFNLDITMEGEE